MWRIGPVSRLSIPSPSSKLSQINIYHIITPSHTIFEIGTVPKEMILTGLLKKTEPFPASQLTRRKIWWEWHSRIKVLALACAKSCQNPTLLLYITIYYIIQNVIASSTCGLVWNIVLHQQWQLQCFIYLLSTNIRLSHKLIRNWQQIPW